MERKYGNRQTAETQEMDTQNNLLSQEYYTCEDYLEIWGQLKDPYGDCYFLKASKSYFGRDEYRTTENDVQNYVFDQKKLKRSIYDRISKNHFIIERKLMIDNTNNYEPAIITCKGRNGIHIGKVKMTLGEKRILKNGDCIWLSQGAKLFEFVYIKSEERSIEKGCNIHKSFYIGEIIGRGACGEVRKVISLTPTVKNDENCSVFDTYAIKCVEKPKESFNESKDREIAYHALLNEVTIMKKIDYVHVLRLFDLFESSRQLILVFPFMRGGDLLSKILKQPKKSLSEDEAKYFFIQLILGLKYLHGKGITHRDIKPENILLSDRGESPLLSIADFGLSKMNDTMKTQCGTEVYVAPEILKNRPQYTNAVDIWSSGVLLFAMLTGKMPFSNNHLGTLRENILKGRYEFIGSIWNGLRTARNAINCMLQIDPRNRYTASLLLEHNWLKDDQVMQRLERAYVMNNVESIDFMDDTTADLEKTLVNVSIHEDENPPKRQKLR